MVVVRLTSRSVVLSVLLGLAAAAVMAAPGRAQDEEALLRRAVTSLFRQAEVLRVDAVPDLYEGGYARVSVYARKALAGKANKLRIDEGWVKIVGATLDPQELREGRLKVLSTRGTAIRMRVSLEALEDAFRGGDVEDVSLSSDKGQLIGRGLLKFRGARVRMVIKGDFSVEGGDVYFHADRLTVNGFPLPLPIVHELDRHYNPVLNQKGWPLTFRLRSIRLTRTDLFVSSDPDALVCSFCNFAGSTAPP